MMFWLSTLSNKSTTEPTNYNIHYIQMTQMVAKSHSQGSGLKWLHTMSEPSNG